MRFVLFVALFCTSVANASAQTTPPANVKKIMDKYACLACHKVDQKLIGPSFIDIANKKKYSDGKMVQLIRNPKQSNWPGYPPMAPIPNITDAEAQTLAAWINTQRKK